MRFGITAAVSLLALLGGCANQDMSDLQTYVARVKARDPGQIEPLPEIKQIETYVYEAGERRSPFRRGRREAEESNAQAANGIAPDPLRRKEELEQFPLDAIRMVGTVEMKEDLWALTRTKEGTLFRVKPGNYMGLNHGQITLITEDRVELTEIVRDGLGGWQERQASVALSE